MEQYLVAIDGLYARDLEEIRQDLNNAISMDTATADEKKRANFLFSLLASLMKERPLLLLRGISVGNGYEAVRQLIRSCQPTNRNRTLGLLQVLMAWPQFDMKQAMLPQILKLEDTFREYERIGGTIPTEMRFAILMKSLSGQLKTYLQITLQDSTSYDDLRESIPKYDAATIKWSQTMSMGTQFPGKEQDDTAVPMDVDRISKGKQKGKNKGKSKDKGKDAGKGKHQGKYSWGAGKGYNNQNNDYWNKQYGKGKKGPPKGTGKQASKGNSGEKGSGGKPVAVCYNCGKAGHLARDCFAKKVRAVEDGQQNAQDGSNNTQSVNQQRTQHAVQRVLMQSSPPASPSF